MQRSAFGGDRAAKYFSFLKPAPYVALLPEAEAGEEYLRVRWQILEATFSGYAHFYFVRNLPFVSKGMGAVFVQQSASRPHARSDGEISSGLEKFLCSLSDRSNKRCVIALGCSLHALIRTQLVRFV